MDDMRQGDVSDEVEIWMDGNEECGSILGGNESVMFDAEGGWQCERSIFMDKYPVEVVQIRVQILSPSPHPRSRYPFPAVLQGVSLTPAAQGDTQCQSSEPCGGRPTPAIHEPLTLLTDRSQTRDLSRRPPTRPLSRGASASSHECRRTRHDRGQARAATRDLLRGPRP